MATKVTVSGSVSADELLTLAELRRRLGWQAHAVRQAKLAGLRLVPFGRSKFVLGADVLEFFRGLAADGGDGLDT